VHQTRLGCLGQEPVVGFPAGQLGLAEVLRGERGESTVLVWRVQEPVWIQASDSGSQLDRGRSFHARIRDCQPAGSPCDQRRFIQRSLYRDAARHGDQMRARKLGGEGAAVWQRAKHSLPAGPLRLPLEVEQHLPRLGHEQHAFGFAVGEVFLADASRVAIAEVDLLADAFRDGRGERDLGAALLDAVFEGADARTCVLWASTPQG